MKSIYPFPKRASHNSVEFHSSEIIKQKDMRTNLSVRMIRVTIVTLVLVFLVNFGVKASTRYSVATGYWSSTSTWSSTSGGTAGASYPVAGDIVYIEGGFAVRITTTGAACTSVTIGTSNGTGTLTIQPTNTTGTSNITFTTSGDVDVASNGTFSITNNTGANTHTVTIGGNLTVDGTFDMTTTTDDYAAVIFNGSSEQTISGSGATCTFYSLTASNTNTVNGLVLTRAISIAVSGSSNTAPVLTVSSGDLFNISTGTCTEVSTGSCTVTGTLETGSSGTLTVGATLSGTGTLSNSGTLNIPGTCTVTTLTATATGNTVNYTGAAQTVKGTTYYNLTLSGSGAKTTTSVTVNGILDMAGTATASVAPTYGGAATLQYDETVTAGPEWLATFVATGGVIINSGTVTLGAAKIFTSVPLTVVGGATLALSTYTLGSPTTVQLYCGASGSTISGSGTLTLGGGVTVTASGTGSSGSTISCPVALGLTRTFTVASNGTLSASTPDLNVSGAISGSTYGITKSGAGLLYLSASNSYTGAVTINAGILTANTLAAVNTSSSLGTGGGTPTITIAGAGTLQYNGTGSSTARVIALSGTGATIDASGSGTMTLTGGVTGATYNLILTGTGAGAESGVIGTTSGTVTKNGTGTWTLSGTNTYTGLTTISAGTLVAGAAVVVSTSGPFGNASSAITLGDANTTTNGSSPSLQIGGAFTVARAVTVANQSTTGTYSIGGSTTSTSVFSGLITLNEPLTISQIASGIVELSYGTISTGSNAVTVSGPGTVQLLTNPLSLGGAFNITAGTFNANGLASTITGLTTVSGGTYSASTALQTLSGGLTISGGIFTGSSGGVTTTNVTLSSGTLTAPSGAFNVSGNWSYSSGTFTPGGNTVTFNGTGAQTIGGSASTTFSNITISNTSAGAVTLGYAENMTGTLTVNAGSTLANGGYTLGSPTTVQLYCGASGSTISGSGTLTLGGGVTVTASGTGSSGSTISCPVALGLTRTFTVASNGTLSASTPDLNVSGAISGSTYGITKSGAGLLYLSASNSYTGAVTINAGILTANTLAAVNTSSSLGTGGGTPTITIAGAGTLQYNGTGSSTARVIALSGTGATIDASGSGTMTLTGGVTGATYNLILTGTGAGAESGVIGTTSGTVTKNGTGTWTLSGTNTYTGLTTISAGTLVAGAAVVVSTSGPFGNASSAITLGDANTTTNGSSPSLQIGGAFTVARAVTVANQSTTGTYSIGGSTTSTSVFSGLITLNEPLTISQIASGIVELSYGTISTGSNAVTVSGPGTVQLLTNPLSLGGAFNITAGTFNANGLASTITGLTTVSGGTYSASTALQTLSGGLTISGGIFTGSSGGVTTTNVTLSSGTLTAPSGAFNVSGNWSYSSGTFTPGGNTVTFNGTGAQTITGTPATAFNNLTLSTSGTKTLASNTTIAGTLTISGAALAALATGIDYSVLHLYLGGVNEPNGNYGSNYQDPSYFTSSTGYVTVNSGCTAGTWLGTTSSDWSDGTNWCGGVPTSSTDVIIPTSATYMPTLSTTGNCNSLTFNGTTSSLTFAGGTLTVTGAVNFTSGIITTSGTSASMLSVGGTFTGPGTTFTPGTYLTVNFTGTSQTIPKLVSSYYVLTLSNASATDVAGGALTANTLNTTAGGILNMGTYQLTVSNLASDGIIRTQNTSSTPIPTGLTWGGTVQYDAATGGQTVVTDSYTTLNNYNTSGTNTASGAITATTLNTYASGTLNMATYVLSGVTTVSNAGTIRTQNTTSAPVPTGKTWGGTVQYDATSGGQTVMAGTYGILTLSNTSGTDIASGAIAATTLNTTASGILNMATYALSGLTTVSNSGTIRTQNTTSAPIPTGLTWGGTVQYDATSGAQTVMAGTYSTLTLSNTSGTDAASGAIAATTLNTTASGTLNMATYALSGLTTVSNAGTIRTQNTSSSPIPSGLTWGGTVTFDGSSIQTVPASTFNNFIVNNSSGLTLSGVVTVNGTLTLTSGKLATTSSYYIFVNNTSSSAVTGYSSSSYVNGGLRWSLATGGSYFFPVGDASNYRPFEMNSITCSSPVVQVNMSSTGATEPDGSTMYSVFPRNWYAQLESGSFTSATIRITESGLVSTDVIGQSISQSGLYSSVGGQNIGSTITSNAGIAYTGSKYFAIGSACGDPTSGGTIAAAQEGCTPFTPSLLTSSVGASGYVGNLIYKWQSSTTGSGSGFSDISGATSATYQPGSLTIDTWYKRLATVDCLNDWPVSSNVLEMTVDPLPTPVISGPTSACANSTGNFYSTPSVSGHTYSWSISGGSIVGSTTGNSITVTWGSAGSGYVKVTETITLTGCTVTTADYNVTINALPTPVISGSTVVCANSTGNTYSTPSVTGHTYSWSISGGLIVGSTTDNSITVTWGAAGSGWVQVTETITATSCAVTTAEYDVTINALPTPVISGPTSVCANSTGNTYSTPSVTGHTYSWSISGGSIVGSTTDNSITVTWGSAGSGWVQVTETIPSSSCSVTTAEYGVTINPLPAPSISGPTSVCANSTGNIYSTGSVSGDSYSWAISGGTITDGAGTNSITVTWGVAGSGWVQVTETIPSSSCTVTTAEYSVTINASPTPTFTTAPGDNTCTNVSVTYTTQSGQFSYIWSVPGISGTDYSITSGGIGGTDYTVTLQWLTTGSKAVTVNYSNTYLCTGVSPASNTTTVNPLPGDAGSITGASSVCQGATGVAYSVPPITDATGYVWTLSSGASIAGGSGTNSITVNFSSSASSGYITVYGTNACGDGTVSPDFAVIVTANQWIGQGNDNNWNNPANWCGGVPDGSTNVEILSDTTVDITSDPTTPAECNDLTIDNGGILIINAGKALTVNGTLTNNSGTSNLVIQDGGSLIYNSGAPSGTVLTNVTTDNYHYMGSVVTSHNIWGCIPNPPKFDLGTSI